MADAQAATAVLVRQGKVAEPVGAMVIPAQRGGVLGAVGGRDGELYVNGRALTREWADRLRTLVPELSSDVDRLQAMRAPGRRLAPVADIRNTQGFRTLLAQTEAELLTRGLDVVPVGVRKCACPCGEHRRRTDGRPLMALAAKYATSGCALDYGSRFDMTAGVTA